MNATTTPTTDHLAPTAPPPAGASVAVFARMIKFSHTVFALPFALAAATLAARSHGISAAQVVAIVLAMVGARTAAMGFNRIADRHIDARNPRTATRELPSGAISLRASVLLVIAATGVFLGAAAFLGPLCLALSPVALVFLFGYSYTKRFTWLCHLVLGFAIAGGPLGAWIAIAQGVSEPALWLTLAVMTWIGGFDILYALADIDFDRKARLNSIPARFGITTSLLLSALLHVVALGALVLTGTAAGLGPIYFAGVAVIGAILIWEHLIVRPHDLSRLNLAFFTLNGYVSVAFFVATLAASLLG